MNFYEVLDLILESCPFLHGNDYDGIIVKKLAATNTISDTGASHQSHIAFTGKQKDFFPFLNADGYFNVKYENKDDELKKYFILQIPLTIYKDNVSAINQDSNIAFSSAEKTVKASVLRSRRNNGDDQIELSIKSLDDEDFIKFRKILRINDFFVLLKRKNKFQYDLVGIQSTDTNSNRLTGCTDFYKIGTQTPVGIENFVTDSYLLSHDQTIFYGVPGCGKSNKIKSILDEAERGGRISDKDEQVVRVVFHPEYTNADFIGQIVPKRDKDGHIDYSFEAGPFANILRRAYLNPEKPYYLIVEEVNRGNAAAIFGDMFQLLDRFGADESEETNSNIYGEGWSAYSVNNADINWYIRNGADESESGEQNAAVEVISNTTENPYSEIKVGGIAISANTGLRLPPNLSILGTMNTSDQNVFTLDNAFQRRWNLVLIENDFPGEGDETWSESVRAQRDAKIEGTEVSWNTFRTEINKIIAQEAVSTGLSSMEDKRLGCWFVKNTGGEISKELFANKVLKYLWDDAFKFSRPKVFGPYTTFEEVRKDFVGSKAFSVFSIKLAGINGGIPADGQSQDERQEN